MQVTPNHLHLVGAWIFILFVFNQYSLTFNIMINIKTLQDSAMFIEQKQRQKSVTQETQP